MKIVVVGGVAAGTKAAAKIKRENRDAEIKILTKGQDISYAGCGLPYYVGGLIETREELIVNSPQKYEGLTGVQVITGCEVTALNPVERQITAIQQGKVMTEGYDELIIATGATPVVPDMPGKELQGVFTMRTPDDATGLRAYIQDNNCRNAVVVGAGFIGLEVAENLMAQNMQVAVIDAAPQIMPNAFDVEMADYAKKKLKEAGMRVITSCKITEVTGEGNADGVKTTTGDIAADVVVLAIGVRPSTAFLEGSGIEMEKGAIVVDEYMRTNLHNVYAAGDCAVVRSEITGEPQWSAMGSTANLTARALAKTVTGSPVAYKGCLGTGVVKLLSQLNAGRTGLTEAQAKEAGYTVATVVCVVDDKAHYYPGASSFVVKLVADEYTHKLLGLQVLGAGAVDKMVDIAVVGLAQGMKLEDFDTLDFAYAPPFSTAIHPFTQASYILQNKLAGNLQTFTPAEYAAGAAKKYRVLDVQPSHGIMGAEWIDLAKVTGPIEGIEKDEKILLVCAKGKRGYFLQNRLKHFGYTNTRVLEGGVFVNTVRVNNTGTLSADEIKRVKGLGCLQDKRYPDHFNVRIITRNGKLTSAEQRAVAEAAELYGSGEVTMTTRLTLEIQGVPYHNIEAVIEYVNKAGLETGGTGSKVRPVVSCKGTTCQYGLCDTFDLSQKLHDLFYVGYHNVSLPHKFKIAVGGCANNCVKPSLNDVGITGQEIPEPDMTKCVSCKVCQVEKSCPINIISMQNGKPVIDTDACNHCGRCVNRCPFGAMTESSHGYKVTIGGRWGKRVADGKPLSKIIPTEEELLELVEKIILFYRDEGVTGERLSDTIDRLGFDYVEDKLLNATFDKDAVMQKEVVGGATC